MFGRWKIVAAAGASAALLLTGVPAQAASMDAQGASAHQAPAAGQTVAVQDHAGTVVGSLHTMTAAEIAARGLTEFAGAVDPSAADTGAAPAPRKSHTSSVTPAAGGCWTFQFKQPGWLGMDGYGSEDWCGSGGSITYAVPACWGTDGWYPTYNYLGCTKTKYYGVGWNVADTLYNFDFCIAWWGGGCAKHRHLWDRYRFGAGGGVWLISYGG